MRTLTVFGPTGSSSDPMRRSLQDRTWECRDFRPQTDQLLTQTLPFSPSIRPLALSIHPTVLEAFVDLVIPIKDLSTGKSRMRR